MNKISILNELVNKPILLSTDYAKYLYSYICNRKNITELETMSKSLGSKEMLEVVSEYESKNKAREMLRVVGNTAIINIDGTLTHKFGYLKTRSGITGYDGISSQLDIIKSDSSINSIVFDINSPGGSVAGCFDLADKIKNIGLETLAVVNEMACSAAYALASSCDKITLNETAEVGSIGVLVAHRDISKKMEKQGEKVTFIFKGNKKVDGNSFEKLSDEVKKDIQKDIDIVYNKFVEVVSSNRGLTINKIIDTQAGVYMGGNAVDIGLADEVISAEQSILKFIKKNGDNKIMSKRDDDVVVAEAENIDKEALTKKGAEAERNRISSILSCEEADGRSKLAEHFAFNTDLDLASIKSALSASAKEVKEVKKVADIDDIKKLAIDNGFPIEAEVEAEAEAEQKVLESIEKGEY